jgi:acyl carrier protein
VGTPNASQLRGFLRDRLPGYMVPSKFVFLEHLPLAGNGKLDRKALPSPEPVRPKLETAYQPPGSAMEAAIAEIWSDLLGLDAVGIYDPFLDLGGDSLTAVQVAVRVGERFGMDITPEVLVDQPTVADLAEYLVGQRAKSVAATKNIL